MYRQKILLASISMRPVRNRNEAEVYSELKFAFERSLKYAWRAARNQLTTQPNATRCITTSFTAVVRATCTNIRLCAHKGRRPWALCTATSFAATRIHRGCIARGPIVATHRIAICGSKPWTIFCTPRVFVQAMKRRMFKKKKKMKIGTYKTVRVEADKSTSGTLVSQNHHYSNNDEHFALILGQSSKTGNVIFVRRQKMLFSFEDRECYFRSKTENVIFVRRQKMRQTMNKTTTTTTATNRPGYRRSEASKDLGNNIGETRVAEQ